MNFQMIMRNELALYTFVFNETEKIVEILENRANTSLFSFNAIDNKVSLLSICINYVYDVRQ